MELNNEPAMMISVVIPLTLATRMQAAASILDMTRSAYVRRLLEDHIPIDPVACFGCGAVATRPKPDHGQTFYCHTCK